MYIYYPPPKFYISREKGTIMVKNCEQCGVEYEAKTSRGRFCSHLCRSRFGKGAQRVGAQPSGAQTNVTVWLDSFAESPAGVTASPETVSIPHFGEEDCGCLHCVQNRSSKRPKILNHGYKTFMELGENEIDRVGLPGDPDYVGCMEKFLN